MTLKRLATMKTKTDPRVVREVRELERRIAASESVMRFMIQSRRRTLERAEQLRKLALEVTRTRALPTAPNFRALSKLVRSMLPFYKAVKMTKREQAAHDKIMRRGR